VRVSAFLITVFGITTIFAAFGVTSDV